MKLLQLKRCGIRKSLYLFNKRIFSWKDINVQVNEYAESLGVKLGKNVTFITLPNVKYPNSWPIFASEPFMIEIGDDAIISFNVTFITHDGSLHNFKKFIDEENRTDTMTLGEIKIGKNCFIGCNTIILPNVTIGDDAIIGAGSVVTKNIPQGEVWAGNPAKFIKTTQELAQKYTQLNLTDKMVKLKEIYKQGFEQYIKNY